MKNKKGIIIACIFVVIFVILCIGELLYHKETENNLPEYLEGYDFNEESKTKDIDAKYKDVTVYKKDKTEVNLSDFKDKPVMILFFNENNEDSIKVLKKVNEMYPYYKDKIEFFMINVSQEVNEKIEEEVELEIYYDFYNEASRSYSISEYPSMIYIDKTNEVFNAKAGFTTTDALEANLDILAENF